MSSDKSYATEARLNALINGDPWHNATMINGWGGTLRYRLSMDQRSVRLSSTGSLNLGTTTNGTFICSPLPAAYRPPSARWLPVGADGSAASGGTAYARLLSDGHIDVWWLPTAGGVLIGFEGEAALDV